MDTNELKKNKNFCMAPFMHLMIDNGDTFRLCCFTEANGGMSANTHSITEAWTSDFYKKIRSEMIDGKFPTECSGCYNLEKQGAESGRYWFNKRHSIPINVETGNDSNFPTSFDLRASNLCNLKCTMCGPVSSSQIIKEIENNKVLYSFNKKNGIIFKKEEFNVPLRYSTPWFEELHRKIVDIKNPDVKLLGGEPTLVPQYIDILNSLAQRNNVSGMTSITTNLTNLNDNIKKTIASFKNMLILCSTDGIGKHLEYIRYPINFNMWHRNFNELSTMAKSSNGGLSVEIHTVAQLLNAYHLPEFITFLKNNNVKFSMTEVFKKPPNPLTFKYIPLRDRVDIADQMMENISYLSAAEIAKTRVTNIISKLKDPTDDDKYTDKTDTVIYLLKRDISRGIHIKDYIPEIYSLIEDQYETTKIEMLKFVNESVDKNGSPD